MSYISHLIFMACGNLLIEHNSYTRIQVLKASSMTDSTTVGGLGSIPRQIMYDLSRM
jgi:hypothetical protein